jgi:hypothetical protein
MPSGEGIRQSATYCPGARSSVTREVLPAPGIGAFGPPTSVAHAGGACPCISAKRSSAVLPSASWTSCRWCISWPVPVSWSVTTPALMVSATTKK